MQYWKSHVVNFPQNSLLYIWPFESYAANSLIHEVKHVALMRSCHAENNFQEIYLMYQDTSR